MSRVWIENEGRLLLSQLDSMSLGLFTICSICWTSCTHILCVFTSLPHYLVSRGRVLSQPAFPHHSHICLFIRDLNLHPGVSSGHKLFLSALLVFLFVFWNNKVKLVNLYKVSKLRGINNPRQPIEMLICCMLTVQYIMITLTTTSCTHGRVLFVCLFTDLLTGM